MSSRVAGPAPMLSGVMSSESVESTRVAVRGLVNAT